MNKYIEFAIFCLLALYIGEYPLPTEDATILMVVFWVSVGFAIVGLFKK